MELKPGYKQTEVGVIPVEWEVKRLGDLFEVTSSKRVFQSEWKSEGIPFYRARELAVLGETGSVKNDLFITRCMYESFKRTHGVPATGDMLVTGVGTLGKVYVVTGDHEFYFKDGNIIWFKVDGSVSPDFLNHLYLTPVVIKQISDGSSGTTVGTYTITNAKKTAIPFPPLPEQRAIAGALGDVDALLGGLEKLIAKKRDLKQAAMQQLLTGQTRLPGFNGTNAGYKQTEVGVIPEDWDVKAVRDLGQIKTGPFGTLLKAEEYSGTEGVPLISVGEVGSGAFKVTEDTPRVPERVIRRLPQYVLRNGDIVFGRKGAVDRSALVTEKEDGWFLGSDGISIRPQRKCFPKYLACQFQRYEVQAWLLENATGTTMASLNQAILNSVQIPYAPVPEQRAIAAILSDMDAELAALEQRLAKTRALKQGMMQELLTGMTRIV